MSDLTKQTVRNRASEIIRYNKFNLSESEATQAIVELVDSEVLKALSEVKSKAEVVEYNSIDSPLFKAVPLSAIEDIERKYL